MHISLDDLKQILMERRLRVDLQGATCIHCALVLPTVDAAKEHDSVCEKHPLVAKVAALERELAEARNDVARLDWLEGRGTIQIDLGMNGLYEFDDEPSGSRKRDDLRAAIDAAMGGE